MTANAYGYHGRYLRIDATNQTARAVDIPVDVRRRFIGGSGLGAWILLCETVEHQNPLDEVAPLAFVFSPLVGSPLTTSAKFAVMSQSPLTLRINDSLSSSHFAIAGKKTGYDAIVVTGQCASPSTLVVTPDSIRFDDARPLWGLSAKDAQQALQQQLGAGFRTAVIGPAGERLVRFATISHDGRHAGRGGSGAVLGSKNIKAIAVAGDRITDWADPDGLIEFSRRLSKESLGPATAKYRELGTVSNLLTFNRLGTLPTRNFQSGTFAEADRLAPETMSDSHHRTRDSCAACTIGCEHIFHIRARSTDSASTNAESTDQKSPNRANGDGRGSGVRMEYENLFALGPLCGVSDPDVVLEASRRCDEFGMDTISTGASIAFAMECGERGLMTDHNLRFGNSEALLGLIDAIGWREGVGELLSMGTRAASKEIGGGSEDFAPHVKGLEIPGYEPRALQTMALGFAVGTRGADHNRSGAYQVDFSDQGNRTAVDESVVPLAIQTENEAALMDSLILCKFLRGVFDDRLDAMSRMLQLVTGFDVTPAELDETAQRIVTAKKTVQYQTGLDAR